MLEPVRNSMVNAQLHESASQASSAEVPAQQETSQGNTKASARHQGLYWTAEILRDLRVTTGFLQDQVHHPQATRSMVKPHSFQPTSSSKAEAETRRAASRAGKKPAILLDSSATDGIPQSIS